MRFLTIMLCALGLAAFDDNTNTANAATQNEQVVNLYSSQQEHLIRPVLVNFTKKTGITVNLTTGGNAELVTRLEYEGENTPADMLLTVDIGNVYQAKDKGLLQVVESEILSGNILAYLRDPEGYWFGITSRARLIFYHKDRVEAHAVQNYADLADDRWKGRVLIRSSNNVYNQSLVASRVAHDGREAALKWAKGLVANMARSPQGGDTDQIKALLAGEGDLAVANSYYYGRLIAGDESVRDPKVAEKIGVIFPDQEGHGTHVNIRGGGVTKYAKNRANAVKLLEYLVQEPAQRFFADANLEYPANLAVKANSAVEAWGEFNRDQLNLEEVGKHQRTAIEVMDEAGWR
ncbi:Fe(3+) ABC transporter substrate-binding protein [Sneathiella sp.]|uniref:Fe(3+) ABC transporter substrate-binding protein n=1 Tax=Sneathiella sp. TaxID=1964365 RepID=UPI0035629A15